MRIAVVGIGGVGGYFGGKLARYYASRKGTEIIFIARGEHLRQIREKGLKQITVEGEFTARPHIATDDPRDLGNFDLVLVSVKRYDLESAAGLIRPNTGNNTTVISLLNGVDNVKPLIKNLPGARILNGCVYIGAHIAGPGVVKQGGGSCQLFFGPEDGCIEELAPVESVLKAAGIQAVLTENILPAVWEKYLFVCPLATATTYLKQPIGAFGPKNENRLLLEKLTREVAEIGLAKGIQISEKMIQEALNKVSMFPFETKTSMQLDFESGRQTEIDLFTGFVVTCGKELSIPTPLHDEILQRLTI
jgi:2-dehydropantoate 2-reductase